MKKATRYALAGLAKEIDIAYFALLEANEKMQELGEVPNLDIIARRLLHAFVSIHNID